MYINFIKNLFFILKLLKSVIFSSLFFVSKLLKFFLQILEMKRNN